MLGRRSTSLFALLAVAALLAVPAFAGAEQAPRSSANLELVASIAATGGTDIEFFSRTLSTYRDASGAEITPDVPIERHFALVGNQVQGPKIVDITDPEKPFVASAIARCTVGQGDPQVTRDGMLAAIAFQTSGSCRTHSGKTVPKGSAMVDLSDVYAPLVVGAAPETNGSHNQTIHPDGQYMYISTSGRGSVIPIYDISDPTAPRLVQKFAPGGAPHDIRFSEDGKRAYLAGPGSAFRIVNTEDPAKPSVIATVNAPGATIGHDTLITPDKRFLFAGEEAGGGGTFPCPGGAIYAYDLANEAQPVLLGVAWAGGGPVTARLVDEVPGPATVGGCTSHVMELNPDKKSLTIGWYTLGTRVFDFSSFYNADGTPKSSAGIVAAWGRFGTGLVETAYMIPDGASTWSAKQYHKVPGYIFSDDLKLGLYVSKYKN